MVEGGELSGVARNAWALEGVWREGNWLHLTFATDVEGVGAVVVMVVE